MLEVISLGAGVQSTTMALMAAHGEIEPMPDAAIFADTGAEPKAVYEHLDWLRSANVLPFPVEIVRAGNIVEDIYTALDGQVRGHRHTAAPPFFSIGKDGEAAPLRRQCTNIYKLEPINAHIRERLGIVPRQRWPRDWPPISMWLGISLDEVIRMKPAKKRWIERRWPLVEKEMTRWDCQLWLERHEYPPPPKSACTICPYRSDREWRWLRDNDPAGWTEAVTLDRALSSGVKRISTEGSTGPLHLHRSMTPLEDVDLRNSDERGQPDLFGNDCEGMCGL